MIDSADGSGAKAGLCRDLSINYSFTEHSCCLKSARHFQQFRCGADILKKALAIINVFNSYDASVKEFNILIMISFHAVPLNLFYLAWFRENGINGVLLYDTILPLYYAKVNSFFNNFEKKF